MIAPPGTLSGQSLEVDVAEWVDAIRHLGYVDDYDGSDRPGLPVAVAENLPSNETPTGQRWDLPWSWCEQMAPDSPMYWFVGPRPYRAGERAATRAKAPGN